MTNYAAGNSRNQGYRNMYIHQDDESNTEDYTTVRRQQVLENVSCERRHSSETKIEQPEKRTICYRYKKFQISGGIRVGVWVAGHLSPCQRATMTYASAILKYAPQNVMT